MPESLVTCPVCLTPNFTPRGLKAHKHKCKGGTRLNRQTGLVEVIELPAALLSPCIDVSEIQIADPKAILCAARSALEKHREIIIGHEEKFAAASLGPRLQMGLSALQAYQVFLIKDPGKKNKTGKNQHSKSGHVTRDMA